MLARVGWPECALLLAIVALLIQLFPSVETTILDPRRWSWPVIWALHVGVLAVLIAFYVRSRR